MGKITRHAKKALFTFNKMLFTLRILPTNLGPICSCDFIAQFSYRLKNQRLAKRLKLKFVPAIAQWIHVCLPPNGPGFESQAHHTYYYSKILYYICHCIEKRTKIKKRPGLAHIEKNN